MLLDKDQHMPKYKHIEITNIISNTHFDAFVIIVWAHTINTLADTFKL